jgi:hypothetical protein
VFGRTWLIGISNESPLSVSGHERSGLAAGMAQDEQAARVRHAAGDVAGIPVDQLDRGADRAPAGRGNQIRNTDPPGDAGQRGHSL